MLSYHDNNEKISLKLRKMQFESPQPIADSFQGTEEEAQFYTELKKKQIYFVILLLSKWDFDIHSFLMPISVN